MPCPVLQSPVSSALKADWGTGSPNLTLTLYRLAQGFSYRALGTSLATLELEVSDETHVLRSDVVRQVQAQGSLSLCLIAKP